MKNSIRFFLYTLCSSIIRIDGDPLQGGENVVQAGENEFPFVVSLARKPATKPRHHFCGGTLISKRHILTAAHCLVNITTGRPHREAKYIRVKIGSNDLTQGRNYNVTFWKTYEEWAMERGVPVVIEMFHDVSIVSLAEEVIDVAPASISQCKHRQIRGRDAATAGWGMMDDDVEPSLLQKAILHVISRKQCRFNFVSTLAVTVSVVNHLCTTQNPPVVFGCGDSGGPLLINGDELIGVNESVCANDIAHPNEQNTHQSVEYYRRFVEEYAEKKAPCPFKCRLKGPDN